MELRNHATYDDVRSLLGVSARELADSVLALPHWMLAVELELRELDQGAGAAITQHAEIMKIAETSRTTEQTYFFKVCNMYVLYSVGRQLLASAETFSPDELSDGRATLRRSTDRFAKMQLAIEGGFQAMRNRLEAALQGVVPTASLAPTVTRRMISSVGNGTDPVTGA